MTARDRICGCVKTCWHEVENRAFHAAIAPIYWHREKK